MTLDELFDHGREFANHMFSATGSITPMWVCVTNDGEILPIMVPMDGNKDMIASALKAFFKAKNVIRYVSIMEGWVLMAKDSSVDLQELIDQMPIRNHPDRKEIITIEASDHLGNSKNGAYYIIRPKNEPVYLSEFEVLSADCGGGRFNNMLVTVQ